jgi:hypothetical protein
MGKTCRQYTTQTNDWNNNMTDKSKLLSNVSLIAAGIEQHRDGTAQAQAGIANISQGIMDNWFYSMRWSYGSGDNEVSGVSNLGDMFKHKSMAGIALTPSIFPLCIERLRTTSVLKALCPRLIRWRSNVRSLLLRLGSLRAR